MRARGTQTESGSTQFTREGAHTRYAEFDFNFLGHGGINPSLVVKLRTNDQRLTTASIERRQLHQIILGHRLQRLAGFAPGGQAADDYERVESSFHQHMRHPGARGFACSSTVEINFLVFGKAFSLFVQVVGFNANRSLDPLGAYVVIAMAAHVRDENGARLVRSQAGGELLHLYARHNIVLAVFAKLHETIDCIDDHRDQEYRFHGTAGHAKAVENGGENVAGKKSHAQISEGVEQRSGEVQQQELVEAHFHAAGQRRGHGVHAGPEL